MKFENMNKRRQEILRNPFTLITHDDLDGIGCAWLLKTFTGNVKNLHIVGYPQDVDNLTIDTTYPVVITDLAVSEEIYQQLRANSIPFIVIDHHHDTVQMADANHPENYLSWFDNLDHFVENGICKVSATYLVYCMINDVYRFFGIDMEKLAEYIPSAEAFFNNQRTYRNDWESVRYVAAAISQQDLGNIYTGLFSEPNYGELYDHMVSYCDAEEPEYWEFAAIFGTYLHIMTSSFRTLYQAKDNSFDRRIEAMFDMLDCIDDTYSSAYRYNLYIEMIRKQYNQMCNARRRYIYDTNDPDKYVSFLCLDGYTDCFTLTTRAYFESATISKMDVIVVREQKQNPDGSMKTIFSFRSGETSKVYARTIAEYFGGGGHNHAAGCANQSKVTEMNKLFGYNDLNYTEVHLDEFPEWLIKKD